ncbi:MAG: hypothetical protein B7Z77_08220, partial [Acidocella sp. 20-58-15]
LTSALTKRLGAAAAGAVTGTGGLVTGLAVGRAVRRAILAHGRHTYPQPPVKTTPPHSFALTSTD